MYNNDNHRKADLIKKSLKIVDELADLNNNEIDEISLLIERAEKLKKDSLWKLR